MDPDRFDTLTRALTAARSRRGIASSLLVSTLGLLGWADAHDAAAKNCKKIENKKKRKKCLKKTKDTVRPIPVSPPPSPCANGVKDGSETDIDCGGVCSRCAVGKTCASQNDCASARCAAGTCQTCGNAGDCGTDTDGSQCFCRDHASGQKFCSKPNAQPGRVFPAGTPCTVCQGSEQCFLINLGADGIECIPLCGA